MKLRNVRLILSMPGVGNRRASYQTSLIHLDTLKIGKFIGSYWRFEIKPLAFDKLIKSTSEVYIGFCTNWEQLLPSVVDQVFGFNPLNLDEYRRSVIDYRNTKEYANVDLKLISELDNLSDKPIEWYVEYYRLFLKRLKALGIPEIDNLRFFRQKSSQ